MIDYGSLSDADLDAHINALQTGGLNPLMPLLAKAESDNDPMAVSRAGAAGKFQIEPATARDPGYGVMPLQNWDGKDPRTASPEEQQRFANDYLNAMIAHNGGNITQGLMAYNGGPGTVDNYKSGTGTLPKETQQYPGRVLSQGTQYAQNNISMNDASPDVSKLSDADLNAQISNLQASVAKLSDADLDAQIAKLQGGNTSFSSRVAADWEKRKAMGNEAADAYVAGKISEPEALFDITGKTVFGGAGDVIGEGVKSAWGAMPDIVTKPLEYAASKIRKNVAESNVGKNTSMALQEGVQAYSDWAKDHPELARHVEAGADIASFLPAGAVEKPLGFAADASGTVLSKTGQAIADSAMARQAASKADFVKGLISPKETPTVRADQFSRATEAGPLKKRVVQPTSQEQAVIDTVAQTPVSKKNSLLANYNIISNENDKEAASLIDKLKKKDVAIHPDEVNAALDSSLAELSKNPYITGDAETTAQRVITGMREALSKNDSTASGLLKARKDFDSWVKSQKGKGIFDPQRDSPASIAVQNVRQTINDLVESKVPDVGYKASLQKQSNLYRAMDNIEQKGAYEAPNALLRAGQKASNLIPVKGALSKAAVLAGGAGAAAYAPVLAGTGLAGYGAYKALSSPILQKALGITLDKTGQILRGGRPLAPAEVNDLMKRVPTLALPAPKGEPPLALSGPRRPLVNNPDGSLRPMTDEEYFRADASANSPYSKDASAARSDLPSEEVLKAQKIRQGQTLTPEEWNALQQRAIKNGYKDGGKVSPKKVTKNLTAEFLGRKYA